MVNVLDWVHRAILVESVFYTVAMTNKRVTFLPSNSAHLFTGVVEP